MKCPKCQAKLLPVDGEMFCLQCGTSVAALPGEDIKGPELEETTDPLLQKAITDVVGHKMQFRLPVSAAEPKPATTAFTSMRAVLAPPRTVLVGGVVAAAPMPVASAPASRPMSPSESAAAKDVVPVMPGLPAAPASALPAAPTPAPLEAKAQAAPAPAVASKALQGQTANLRQRLSVGWHAPSRAWITGIAVFVAFLGVNVALQWYFTDRVYAGVKVGQLAVGGMRFSEARSRLATVTPPGLALAVGGQKYSVDTRNLATVDLDRADRELRAVGHSTPLPLAAAIEAWFARPVDLHWVVSEANARHLTQDLSVRVNRAPHDPVPLIVGGQALVISDKVGLQLDVDKTVASIRNDYGVKTVVNVTTEKLVSLVPATAYSADVEAAQAMMALSLQLKTKTITYSPTASQIGQWLRFSGPGKGVALDQSQVAAYVADLPGKFDRGAAATAVVAGIVAKRNVLYDMASGKVTAAPKLAALPMSLPVATYRYCVQSEDDATLAPFEGIAAQTLGDAHGWGLAGRLVFKLVDSDCNITLHLVKAGSMAQYNQACAGATTCQVGDDIVVSADAWAKPPAAWMESPEAFRVGALTHEMGHWLGFDHASCDAKAPAVTPILASPTLVLDGCSPNWYELPAETQGAKVLPGF